jgi:hypothetical protein
VGEGVLRPLAGGQPWAMLHGDVPESRRFCTMKQASAGTVLSKTLN